MFFCFFAAFTSNSNFVILIERVKFISNIAAKYIGSSEFHHENSTKLQDINDFS